MPIAKIGQTRLGQNKNKDPLLPIIFFCHCCIRTHGVSIVLYSLGLATIVYVDGDFDLGDASHGWDSVPICASLATCTQ